MATGTSILLHLSAWFPSICCVVYDGVFKHITCMTEEMIMKLFLAALPKCKTRDCISPASLVQIIPSHDTFSLYMQLAPVAEALKSSLDRLVIVWL
jgi:hypothetical protein